MYFNREVIAMFKERPCPVCRGFKMILMILTPVGCMHCGEFGFVRVLDDEEEKNALGRLADLFRWCIRRFRTPDSI